MILKGEATAQNVEPLMRKDGTPMLMAPFDTQLKEFQRIYKGITSLEDLPMRVHPFIIHVYEIRAMHEHVFDAFKAPKKTAKSVCDDLGDDSEDAAEPVEEAPAPSLCDEMGDDNSADEADESGSEPEPADEAEPAKSADEAEPMEESAEDKRVRDILAAVNVSAKPDSIIPTPNANGKQGGRPAHSATKRPSQK
jgi:hypothetical protein